MKESSRQLIHLSGALFVLLAQFTGRAAAVYFFAIAFTLLFYSWYLARERSRLKRVLDTLDRRVRGRVMRYERPGIPMQGAFWFYFACGLAFLLFPFGVATLACLILAVSDSLATVVGHHVGHVKLVGKKTLEGSGVFFISALALGFFLLPQVALAAALAATAGELLPEAAPGLRQRGLLDDNLLIPLLAGAAVAGVQVL